MNKLAITIRRLKKSGNSVLLSFAGLIIGLVSVILIFLWANDEMSLDRHNKNYERIFRVYGYLDDGVTMFFGCPPMVGPTIANDEPTTVEYSARFIRGISQTIRHGKNTEGLSVCACDVDYFKIFTINLIEGRFPENRSEAIISKSAANKLLNGEKALGNTINYEKTTVLTVVGVYEDLPQACYGSANDDVFIDLKLLCESWGMATDSWWNNSFTTAILLRDKADGPALAERWRDRIQKEDPNATTKLKIEQMTEKRLEGSVRPMVNRFAIITILILLASIMSYVNLNMARSMSQAKELAVRKVYGANRKDLMSIIFGDILTTCFIAFVVAIVISALSLPFFNSLIDKNITLSGMLKPTPLLFYLLTFITTVVLSGIYPALVLTGKNATSNINGGVLSASKRNIFRNMFILLMYICSITIFISMGVVNGQIRYLRNVDLGLNSEQTLLVGVGKNIIDHLDAVKEEMLKSPDVAAVSFTNQHPSQIGNSSDSFSWEGKDDNFNPLIQLYFCDHDIFDTYQIKLIEGKKSTNNKEGVFINETFAKKIGWDSFAGRQLYFDGRPITIDGVFKDFLFNSLNAENAPMMILPLEDWISWGLLTIRFNGSNPTSVIELARQKFNEYTPDEIFSYNFVNQEYEDMLTLETRLQKLAILFGILAFVILCLGSLGVIMFTTEQKFKETGIRKYLGEAVPSLMLRFLKPYIALGVIGAAVSCVIGFKVAMLFLSNYAYHIELNALYFIIPSVLIILMTCIVVSWQSYKASTCNPIDAIRTE